MITDMLFAQYKPGPGDGVTLYTVPPGCSAKGTLYVAAQDGFDIVSVMLIPNGISSDLSQYILANTKLVGNVPIYLQLIYLGEGDSIFIRSETGDCSFTFTGEEYS
jgi:hypothetical protein